MAKQVFVANALSDLQVQVGAGSLAAISSLAAGDKEVAFFANGKSSIAIDADEASFVAFDYSAGTSQVATADLGAASGYVKVINTTIGTMNLPMKTFEGTAAEIAAAITAAGGDFEAFTATAASNVVTVTAAVNSTFRLAANDGATIAYTVAAIPSTGTSADVDALIDAYAGYDGITNRVGFPVKRPASPVVDGSTYDIFVIDAYPTAASKDGMNALKAEAQKIIIAVDSVAGTNPGDDSAAVATALGTWL